jgi:hypothetical protein
MAICPLLSKCELSIGFAQYREQCSNIREDKYLECKHFKKATSETRKPKEWSQFLSPIALAGTTPRKAEEKGLIPYPDHRVPRPRA